MNIKQMPRSEKLRWIANLCILLSFVFSIITLVFIVLESEKRLLLLSSIGSITYFLFFLLSHFLSRRESNKEDFELIKQLDFELRQSKKDKEMISLDEIKQSLEELNDNNNERK